MKRSILTEKVARRGFDIFREYGVDPLERVRVEGVMSRQVVAIESLTLIREAGARFFGEGVRHHGFPVVDGNGLFCGMLTVTDVLRVTAENGSGTQDAGNSASSPVVTVGPKDSCRVAAERMAQTGFGRLPVVEASPGGWKLVGILTRGDLLKARLQSLAEEGERERFWGRSRKGT